MIFSFKVIDTWCKVREKLIKPDFIIGYRLSSEKPFEKGLTIFEALKLVRTLVSKLIQYIHISQLDYFKKTRRGEGAGIERLKIIKTKLKEKWLLLVWEA